MTTLADLRRLLDMAPDGPARQRAGGTVEGMARHYFARLLWVFWPGQSIPEQVPTNTGIDLMRHPAWCGGPVRLDMSEDGTRRALLTGLALAMGLDPGVGALGVMWGRHSSYGRLELVTFGGHHTIFMDRRTGHTSSHSRIRHIYAPTVANEPDPVRALALAVAHVLANP